MEHVGKKFFAGEMLSNQHRSSGTEVRMTFKKKRRPAFDAGLGFLRGGNVQEAKPRVKHGATKA
jgi:hypothetical protein